MNQYQPHQDDCDFESDMAWKESKGNWPLVPVVKIPSKDNDGFEQNSGFCKNDHISYNMHFTQKILIIETNPVKHCISLLKFLITS